jgi:transcriptional regulator GlxA family with amidase domain
MRDAGHEAALAVAVTELLDNADRSLERDREGARRLIARATRLLAAGLTPQLARPSAAPERSGLAPWQVQQVTAKVTERLSTKLSVAELAAIARLSSHHFSRAFKVSFGRSPHAYILCQRIERAQHLMLTTSDSLAQVAVACGLSDQAHLSRLFRQVVGSTPSAWRRQHRAQR